MGIVKGLTAAIAFCRQALNDARRDAEHQTKTENLLAVERETGIEPVPLAWKAKVLPLNYSRLASSSDHPSVTRIGPHHGGW
jgi:hypothetical protein